MAFPSDAGTHADDLSNAWQGIRGAAGTIKSRSQWLRDLASSSGVSADLIVRYLDEMVAMRVILDRMTAVPGLSAYVRQQIDNQTIDIVAEFQTMRTQLAATIQWIVDNFPKSNPGGYASAYTLTTNGTQFRTLAQASLAGLVTQIDSLIATID